MAQKKITKLLHILGSPNFTQALFTGAAAGVEHLPVLRRIQCDYVVDVGANRGQFALAARAAFPTARIVAFEPLDVPAAVFERVFRGDERVKLHRVALGDAEGAHAMHVSHSDDSSSLLPIGEQQTALFHGTGEREQRMVQVAPLSAFIELQEISPDALLKIDVQGYELTVLGGCIELLPAFSHVYVECSFITLYQGQAIAYQVIDWLSGRGLYIDGVYNIFYDRAGRAIQGDFLFSRRPGGA
ncbi:MAG: FkbM family methyltransferase [Anaerolineae bacterium]|nr:FkbM family methyltransferase [Anaerolineae bacterium]